MEQEEEKKQRKKIGFSVSLLKKVIRRVNENIEDEKKEREFVVESECCVLLESMMKCKLFQINKNFKQVVEV